MAGAAPSRQLPTEPGFAKAIGRSQPGSQPVLSAQVLCTHPADQLSTWVSPSAPRSCNSRAGAVDARFAFPARDRTRFCQYANADRRDSGSVTSRCNLQRYTFPVCRLPCYTIAYRHRPTGQARFLHGRHCGSCTCRLDSKPGSAVHCQASTPSGGVGPHLIMMSRATGRARLRRRRLARRGAGSVVGLSER